LPPLANVRVLEVANFISGPFAGLMLAEMGADVIKVEAPGSGDPFRRWEGGQYSPEFCAYNAGKRSLCLDLKDDRGRDAFVRMAERADVLIQNLRPGAMDRLGLGYGDLRRVNPRLIYCSISGFGGDGPGRNRPSYDTVAQGYSSLLSQLVDPRHPRVIGPAFSDQIASLYVCQSVLAALLARGQTGVGQHLEVSMVRTSLHFLCETVARYLANGEILDPLSRPRMSQSYAAVARDGLPLIVHLSSPPKFWEGLLRAIDRPDLASDPDLATRDDRVRNYERLALILQEAFRRRSRSEWLERLEAEDVPCAPVYHIGEALGDPDVASLARIRSWGHPFGDGAAVRGMGPAVSFEPGDADGVARPPTLGEHTEEVLREYGLSDGEIRSLVAGGVAAQGAAPGGRGVGSD
jgi:crotonobetainyl-CoA:carnitine CoA-transferase CaiB-like acyl-CoA transferase